MKRTIRIAVTVAILAPAGLAGPLMYAQPDGADRYDTGAATNAVAAASDVNIGVDAIQPQPQGGWVYSPQGGWQPDWMD